MKLTKLIIALALVAILLPTAGCKKDDSPTTPTPSSSNLYPMKIGNYWVYDANEIDTTGAKVAGTYTLDSVVITGKTTKDGKECFVLSTYSDGELLSEGYQYIENNILYMYLDMSGANETFGKLITQKWVPMIQFNGTTWNIMPSTSLKQSGVDVGSGMKANLDLTFKIDGSKLASQTITVPKGSFNCSVFNMLFDLNGTITLDAFPIPISIPMKMNTKTYAADGVGLVKSIQEATKMNVMGQVSVNNGNMQELVRYKIIP